MRLDLPEANIILKTCKKLWVEDNFLKGFKVLIPPVKPWEVMIFQRPMVTLASRPIVLITDMVE